MTRDDFAATVTARMLVGREEYGDGSFLRPPAELVGELREEALDVVGWAYILWVQTHGLDMADPLAELPRFLALVWEGAHSPPAEPPSLPLAVAISGVCTLLMLEGACST